MPSLAFNPPLLPTLVETPPEGGDWAHEIKFDGYRTQIVIDEGGVRLFTRNGHDWSAKYRTPAAALEERRNVLADLIEPGHEPIRFSESLAGSGSAVFKAIGCGQFQSQSRILTSWWRRLQT